ncbi:MAG: hypothetical protein Q7U30_16565, partial [Methylicorpusculum sp.]|nr:hypothetical protein [Methylicorpusculum sp.]
LFLVAYFVDRIILLILLLSDLKTSISVTIPAILNLKLKRLGEAFRGYRAAGQIFYSGQNLHFHPPWLSDAAVKPPWKSLRHSSNGFFPAQTV